MIISVEPDPSLIDEPVHILIKGLHPNQQVTVRASRITQTSRQNIYLTSFAKYQADHHGQIDLAQQASTRGTYTGVDPMGLFWSFKIDHIEDQDNTSHVGQILQQQTVVLQVESSGDLLVREVLPGYGPQRTFLEFPFGKMDLSQLYFRRKTVSRVRVSFSLAAPRVG